MIREIGVGDVAEPQSSFTNKIRHEGLETISDLWTHLRLLTINYDFYLIILLITGY